MSEGTSLERRQAESVVQAVPIPTMLRELGVRVGEDEVSGLRVVVVPPELRQHVNVINPTSSFTQADRNWTPGISLVTIDVERDTYSIEGKRGLSKQALETIAKAAGVLYTRTTRVPRDELQEGERWAYRATVGFRRSDGTMDEVTRERGFNEEAERDEIVRAVRKSDRWKDKTEAEQEAEVERRWLNELRFGPSKTESKAINRALRAGLAIPTSLKLEDARKPFLVIGYNFTPDYDDVEVKRMLVAAGLNAHAAIYGGREVSGEIGPGGDVPGEATPVPPAEGDEPEEPLAAAREQAPAGDEPVGAPRSDDEPSLEEEPAKPAGIQIPGRAIEEAGQVVARGEKTIAEVAGMGAKGRDWLAWALRNLDEEDERLGAIRLYLEQRAPELWAELTAELEPEGD